MFISGGLDSDCCTVCLISRWFQKLSTTANPLVKSVWRYFIAYDQGSQISHLRTVLTPTKVVCLVEIGVNFNFENGDIWSLDGAKSETCLFGES